MAMWFNDSLMAMALALFVLALMVLINEKSVTLNTLMIPSPPEVMKVSL